MDKWKSFYPDAGDPTIHNENRAFSGSGNYLVLNVLFSELGTQGVIYMSFNQLSGSTPNLLAYRATFIDPYNAADDTQGGAISCYRVNCVQYNVFSSGAYSELSGSHSAVTKPEFFYNTILNTMIGCSIINSRGKNSVLDGESTLFELQSLNISDCNGEEHACIKIIKTQNSLLHNYSIINNIIGTSSNSDVFYYEDSKANITYTIFSNIRNEQSPIYRTERSYETPVYFDMCHFIEHKGTSIFDSAMQVSFGKYYFDNPEMRDQLNNDLAQGSEYFELNIKLYSPGQYYPDAIVSPQENNETLLVDRPNYALLFSLMRHII